MPAPCPAGRCGLIGCACGAAQIKRSAHALTARAGKEGKPQPAPGTDSSLYLLSPETKIIVIYEDKATADEARPAPTPRPPRFGAHGPP